MRAELPEKVLLMTVRAPPLKIAPPSFVELLEKSQLVTVSAPLLRIAPPWLGDTPPPFFRVSRLRLKTTPASTRKNPVACCPSKTTAPGELSASRVTLEPTGIVEPNGIVIADAQLKATVPPAPALAMSAC